MHEIWFADEPYLVYEFSLGFCFDLFGVYW
jgi:hypothetical protein